MADDRAQARREAASLLGVDIEHLSAADGLRVDMVSALRLVIDSEQAGILSGGSADLGKLNVAVQSLIALLPNRELPESAASRADPRAHMWAVYSEMRRRGADVGQGYDGALNRIAELEAEVAALKAGVPAPGESTAPPLPDNVVKLSTRVDNPSPPAAPPKPAPQPQAAPTYDYNTDQSWRSHVLPDGTIIPTPFGGGSKYWGPV
jgi:hypothetical protein